MLLHLIRERKLVSRTDISEEVGLTNAAVSRITKELIEAGLVEEGERIVSPGQAGRRQVMLQLAQPGAYVLGISIALNVRNVALANIHGDIIAKIDCADISLAEPTGAMQEFAKRARHLVQQSGIDRQRLLGGAASVASRVDPNTGNVSSAEPIGWDGQQVGATFQKLLDLPFIAEGRAAALLQAERQHGQAVGLSDILLVNIGLKLGVAFMTDGHLIRGARNDAFQFGQYRGGDRLPLDDLASGFAILSRLEDSGIWREDAADPGGFLRRLATEVAPEDKRVQIAFRESGAALGAAIAQMTPILAPQIAIIAGFVGRQPDYVEGVRSQLGDVRYQLVGGQFTSAQSAIHLALESHIFHESLDIDRLFAAMAGRLSGRSPK